ncbi:hypothetical protein MTQ01_24485 [Streptomyces sp. XM4193]|uniref:hypothetical protein n=1 Tax=Streptomyces sp. XM4193 TaxID=2929782 RepID=UPI001FF73E11|nr:hypothetical protein [Streptomyces sp. XM4193]MCK1799128.1 hypothetical protein [Streptomyces sp. XM4193]
MSPRRVLECTDRRLLLVYRHIEPTGVELAEVGWEIPLGHLRWIRQRRDSSSCFYEFGFADGSWASIELGPPQELEAVQGFLALFPNVHLPAEENPSKGLAKSLRQEWESRRAAV